MMQKIKKLIKKVFFFFEVSIKNVNDFDKIRLFFAVHPYTMVSYQGLNNVYELSKKIENDKIRGAFVECGVWKGGCAAIMGFVAEKAKSGRKIWLFDSFEGLPEPTIDDGIKAKDYALGRTSGKLSSIEKCVGPLGDVKKIFFDVLKINPMNVSIEKGWFQDTLLRAKDRIGTIAILRLDGDWYESTKSCLDYLYDIVVPGGYVIIDDYGFWEGSRKAVDDFMKKRGIKANLIKVDFTAVYFQKP